MAKIIVNNPKQVIYGEVKNNPKQVIYGGAKKYYFKVKGLGGLKGDRGDKGDKGDKGDTGAQGLAGANGADGFSPIATVTPTDTGATISITDVNGTTTANIANGTDGQNGANGQNGADGFSPIATVTQTSTGATISITDAQGTTTADIANGTGSNAPIATTSVAGIVKPDGSTIKVTADGTISSASEYTLPPATDTTLGGVKVGSNLSITDDGTLSADAQQVTLYSTTGQNTDGAMTQKATTDALELKADSSSLAPVATSGDYNDLNNLPTPPTVNNGALTIQQNGTTLGTFTANSSDDKTVNIQAITAEEVGAITTNMIADGAVTAEKIGWTTMTSTYAHASTNTSVQYPTSFGNFLTVTVPQTGTFRIESMVHAATNELAQYWYARARIAVNGSVPDTLDPYVEALIAGKSDYYACATISNNGVVSLTQGDVVALQLQTGTNNSKCRLQYADLFIQRIS